MEGQHRQLQEAHGVLKVAHAEQGASLQRQLAQARQRLSDALEAQEAVATDAAEAAAAAGAAECCRGGAGSACGGAV